jgi:hypothetical protein
MIEAASSRLAIIATLLGLQVFVFILELLIFVPSIKVRGWYTPLRQWCVPVGIALLGVVLVSVTFANVNVEVLRAGKRCSVDVDGDIAGDGVRIAAFVQVGVLLVVSLFGIFHTKATGAKEIGAGLVLTSVSLAMALMVRAKGTLTPPDAAIGAMILDGQTLALSIQLVAKETLASRWQTMIVVLAQFFWLRKRGRGRIEIPGWIAFLGQMPLPHSLLVGLARQLY